MNNYILHLETATKVCSVALSNNGNLIAIKENEDGGYTHGENLNTFIIDVLSQAKIEIKALNAVSISSGPGSYTGLRIGAATAKSLCYALDIPLIAIDSLMSLAYLGIESYPEVNLCPVIDARRMEVYNAIYNSNLTPLKSITADIITPDIYNQYLPLICFGDGAEKLKEVLSGKDIRIDTSIRSSAKGQVVLADVRFRAREFEDVAYWEPFYLKDFIVGKKKE